MWLPDVTAEPVAYRGLGAQPGRAAILHTNDGPGGDLFGWWSSCAAGAQGPLMTQVGAHFQVRLDGSASQYVDTASLIWHAYSASTFAVGIETEDRGTPALPWSGPQLDTMAAILHALGVPATMLSAPTPGDGIGYHEQFSAWNQSGHTCPGTVRQAQIPDLLRRLAARYAPPAPTTEVPDMLLITNASTQGTWYILGSAGARHIGPAELALYRAAGVPVKVLPDAQMPTS